MNRVRVGTWLVCLLPVVVLAGPVPLPNNSVVYLPLTIAGERNERHGLAWSWIGRDPDAPEDYGASWYYHWSTRTIAGVAAEFVPMLWSDWPSLKAQLLQDVSREYCGPLLVANEPEFDTQANMTIEQLIDLVDWVAVMYPCAYVVAPQSHVCWYELDPPTPPCPAMGERFTVEGFIRQYQATHEGANPPVDAWGLHYGDVTVWPGRLAGLLAQLQIEPVFWYTEFNFCGADMARFGDWLNHLNYNPLVERYAYWTNLQETNHCVLADFDTRRLTELGLVYEDFGYAPD